MEEGESVLEAIYEDDDDDDLEDREDIEMVDVEEGELIEDNTNVGNQGSQSKNRKRRGNKKKNKNKKPRSGSGPYVKGIDRFVLETCRRLKEKKSYMVYTAVGCLGVSALSDLVKQVDAIQACGGQMTADGRRNRTGGGILWNVIKAQAPTAYKEIMKKAREFEKQFRQQNIRQGPEQNKEGSSQRTASAFADATTLASVPEGSLLTSQNPDEQPSAEGKRKSVQDRIRVPVSYDDLLGDDQENDST